MFARLAEREAELPAFARFHAAGHDDPDGIALIAAIGRAAGRADRPTKPFPWTAARLASPFDTTLRELVEMAGLWRAHQRLDNARLVARLGAQSRIPLDEAVAATLRGLDVLPAA